MKFADAVCSGAPDRKERLVSKRMVKRQQMQWTERGVHLLLQTRTRVLNGELEETFRRWYSKFRPEMEVMPAALKPAA